MHVQVTFLWDKRLKLSCVLLFFKNRLKKYKSPFICRIPLCVCVRACVSVCVYVCVFESVCGFVCTIAHTSLSQIGPAVYISIGILGSSSAEKAHTDWFPLIYASRPLSRYLNLFPSSFPFCLFASFTPYWPSLVLHSSDSHTYTHTPQTFARRLDLYNCVCVSLCAGNSLVPVRWS